MSSRPNHDVDVAIWPDIWSAGQVCAFSGLDGPTHWTSAVGGRTLADQCGFLFDTQPSIKLILRATIDGQPVLDVFDPLAVPRCRIAAAGLELALPLATGGEVLVRLAFDAGERLIGRVTVGGGTVAHRLAMFLELQSNETSLIAPSRLVTPGRQLASSFRPAALQRALPSDGVAPRWPIRNASKQRPRATMGDPSPGRAWPGSTCPCRSAKRPRRASPWCSTVMAKPRSRPRPVRRTSRS